MTAGSQCSRCVGHDREVPTARLCSSGGYIIIIIMFSSRTVPRHAVHDLGVQFLLHRKMWKAYKIANDA